MVGIGIDGWWVDGTEGENEDLVGGRVKDWSLGGEVLGNVYGVVVKKRIYEGLGGVWSDEGKESDCICGSIVVRGRGFGGIEGYGVGSW